MLCRTQAIGLALIGLGAGLLLGSLIPARLLVWALALIAIALGVVIIR